MKFPCTVIWTILGFVISSSGRSPFVNEDELTRSPALSQSSQSANLDRSITSVVVPQVGVLEEMTRANVSGIGKDDTLPMIMANPGSVLESGLGQSDGTIGNNVGKGILVPIVSVVDGDSSNKTNDNFNDPLVALLPASLPSEARVSKLPVISTLPVVHYDEDQSVRADKPEIRRSLDTGYDDGTSVETMDVAEDIVFRPLFRIHPTNGKSWYSMRNIERNYRPNYRRYNVNGYYRLPYKYLKSNYGNRYDYSE